MSFLSPLFLIGAAAAAIPILLHLLKRQPEVRVAFSAVHFLKSAPVETKERRRLRELLLLALRVAGLVLLSVAFARPFLGADVTAVGGGVTVVALDTSLSMSAPGQFERARQRAREALDGAPAASQTAVILFDTTARVVSPLSADVAMARDAIAAAQPGQGATRYREALRAASQLASGRSGSIVVVTDLQASGWQADDRSLIPASLAVEVVDIGTAPANVAVTSSRVSGQRIVAGLRNASPEPRDVRVRLTVNTDASSNSTTVAGETTVALGAQQTSEVSFPAARGRWAAVTIDDPGGLAADDARYLVLDSAARPRVLVITAGGDLAREAFFAEQALIAEGADGRAYDVEGVAAASVAELDRARLDAATAVVLLSTRGLEHRGREVLAGFVKSGGGLLVAAGPEIDGEAIAGVLGGMRVTVVPPAPDARPVASSGTVPRTLALTDMRHPVLEPFRGRSSLALVSFDRVSVVRAPDCQELAHFTSGEAALIDCAPGDGRALILASDLAKTWNDFPIHPTFVPFVHEAVGYLSGRRGSPEYFVGEVPAGVVDAPGVSSVPGPGAPARLVAVNVDAAESDPARLTEDQFQAVIAQAPTEQAPAISVGAREREERQHIWQYILVVMLAAMIVESLVAARTA